MAESIYQYKVCNKCGDEKKYDDFHRNKFHSTGRASICKMCKNDSNQQHYQLNKTDICKKTNEYYHSHKDQYKSYPSTQPNIVKQRNILYYDTNKVVMMAQNKQYKKLVWKNRDWYPTYYSNMRHHRTRIATPKWADGEDIKKIYQQCRAITTGTGILHEVDHIIPISNKKVCGLHCVDNLRIITRNENRKKHNKMI